MRTTSKPKHLYSQTRSSYNWQIHDSDELVLSVLYYWVYYMKSSEKCTCLLQKWSSKEEFSMFWGHYILSGFKKLSFLSSWRFPSSRSYHLEKSMYQLTSFFPLKFQLNSLLAAWCQCILLFEDGMEIVIRAFKDSFTDRVRHSTMSSFHWYTFR